MKSEYQSIRLLVCLVNVDKQCSNPSFVGDNSLDLISST